MEINIVREESRVKALTRKSEESRVKALARGGEGAEGFMPDSSRGARRLLRATEPYPYPLRSMERIPMDPQAGDAFGEESRMKSQG